MNKPILWLRDEIEIWVGNGLVTPEQADRIRALYPAPKAALPWGTILFSGLGAVILGLGVILLLAYNWNAIPREGKLALVFASIAAAHGGGIALSRRVDGVRQLGETLTVLGSMLFGAGIWLIAQIYHIEEHFPNGFLIWALGTLAMAWVFPSLAQAILAAVLLCIWNCTEAWSFNTPIHVGPLLILAGAGGVAWWQQSRVALFVVLSCFSLSLVANVSTLPERLIFPVLLSVSALFIALSILLPRRDLFPNSRRIWALFGWAGFLIVLYILSFHDAVDGLMDWRAARVATLSLTAQIYLWVPFLGALLAWVTIAQPALSGPNRSLAKLHAEDCPMEYWLVPLTTVACWTFVITTLRSDEMLIAGVFNLVALALAATWMARGSRHAELRSTVLGSLLLAALAAGRYFDLFQSLALRGAVFVLVGGVLFAEGILYSRARRKARKEPVR